MKRTGTSTGTLAPALLPIILIAIFIFAVMTDAASARDKQRPVKGGGREGSAQKIPDRPKQPAPRPQPAPRSQPAVRPENKPVSRPAERPAERPSRQKPENGSAAHPDKARPVDKIVRPPREKAAPPDFTGRLDPPSGGTFRRPPRDIDKKRDGEKIKEKIKGPNHREGRKEFRRPPKEGIIPVVGGGGWSHRPHHPHCPPPVHYTRIEYRYYYQPVIIPGLIDDDIYSITLPFGPILPWEIGELFLIRLKNLEEKGLGGTMMTSIIQTYDEMGWEQFLARYQPEITDVTYYGRVGRTAFLVGMTVSDILDLMVIDGIRWVGEFYPEYKIVPGARNSKFFVRSLEGDTVGFRRELRDVGVFVMGFDHDTQEYYVRSSEDTYDAVVRLWWVARISGTSDEPFFQPEYEYLDVGMAP